MRASASLSPCSLPQPGTDMGRDFEACLGKILECLCIILGVGKKSHDIVDGVPVTQDLWTDNINPGLP